MSVPLSTDAVTRSGEDSYARLHSALLDYLNDQDIPEEAFDRTFEYAADWLAELPDNLPAADTRCGPDWHEPACLRDCGVG